MRYKEVRLIDTAAQMRKLLRQSLLTVLLAQIQILTGPGCAVAHDFSQIPQRAKSLNDRLWENAGEIYKPQLPDPVFLDAAQAKVAKEMQPKLADLVVFYDPKMGVISDTVPKSYQLKAWTSAERLDVEAILARLLKIAPSLLINAASGDKLLICRNTTGRSITLASEGNSVGTSSAMAYPGAVLISDSFFLTSYQFHGLTHELVHEADLSGRFCYSRAWIDFINPTISSARTKLVNSQRQFLPSIRAQLSTSGVVPTPYACENLREAFAEIVASYIDGSFNPSAETIKQVRPFLTVNPKNMLIERQFKRAESLMRRSEYVRATALFEENMKSAPDLPQIRKSLCRCYARVNKLAESAAQGKEAVRLYEAARTPYSDSEMERTADDEIYAYGKLKEYTEALDETNRFLRHVPFARNFLYRRFWLEYTSKENFSDAVRDLYFSRTTYDDYETIFRDVDGNTELVAKLLDDNVEAVPNFPMTLLRRAHFNEWRGDCEPDPVNKNVFYEKALADYERASHPDSTAFPEILFDCCDLNLKLGRLEKAEKYLDDAIAARPNDLETKLMRSQIFASKGDVTWAEHMLGASEYAELFPQTGHGTDKPKPGTN